MKTPIKNSNGITIGYTDFQNGKKYAYNAYSIKLGHYDTQANTTHDANGIKLGEGDFVSALIVQASNT